MQSGAEISRPRTPLVEPSIVMGGVRLQASELLRIALVVSKGQRFVELRLGVQTGAGRFIPGKFKIRIPEGQVCAAIGLLGDAHRALIDPKNLKGE